MKTTVGDVTIECELAGFYFGVVRATHVRISASSADLSEQIDVATSHLEVDEQLKSSVRNMLRYGKYKPTGRGKPACEYLLKAAQNQKFPRINNLVDALNLVSVTRQLPISVIDTDLANSHEFTIRRGKADESYIFNSAGQSIGLTDLLLVASSPDDVACANPIKDSLRTKLQDSTTNVLAVVYGTVEINTLVSAATEQLGKLYARCCEEEGQVSTSYLSS